MKEVNAKMIPEVDLMSANRHVRHNGMSIPENSHKWLEFVYYISCEGKLILNGCEYDIRPGRFVTIPPNILHSEYHTAEGMVFFCILNCDVNFECEVFEDDTDRMILRLCESVYAEQQNPTPESRDLQKLMVQELLLRVSRWKRTKKYRKDLNWAADHIKMNFREQLMLSETASQVGYGYDYFQHLFKETFGRSPKQFQIDCRVDEAKKLLLSNEYTCTEIAYLCGFSDSAQFSSIFRNRVGCSPKDWKKQN